MQPSTRAAGLSRTAVRIATDMVKEKLITKHEALLRVDAEALNQLLQPVFSDTELKAAQRAGRAVFFITERGRYGGIASIIPTRRGRETLRIVDDSNVHVVLARAEL